MGGSHTMNLPVLASPHTVEPMLEAPQRRRSDAADFLNDTAFNTACAYWTALLQLLLYSFGWARPERGLRGGLTRASPPTTSGFSYSPRYRDADRATRLVQRLAAEPPPMCSEKSEPD